MPGKSRHKKGRRSPQEARRRAPVTQPVPAQAGAAEAVRPAATVARLKVTALPAAMAPPAAPTYPYIGKELQMIIILGGIILIALIVVAILTR